MSSKSSTTAPQKTAKSVEVAAAHIVPVISTPEGIAQARATNATVASIPFNENKLHDSGADAARNPPVGQTAASADPAATGSTLTENVESLKVGGGIAPDGINANDGSLDRVRVDSSGQQLTTNQGVPVGDNQNSLKAGLRGPTLLEDFILREKITHFDHERIPERVVHARGSGAHGYFESYKSLSKLTRASLFSEPNKRTPVFVRFSTVAGERGSVDTARDVRGFAVKFYTDEGNWDLVGNNIPVFFIQDAIKFPDLVHAVKPEPHNAIPQAASAHDTFWDFVSLMPESTHMLLWVMSDRGIPRSYRMMQGFGVHTFRLVNTDGDSRFVKFHWKPLLGTHSLVWDEAVKIAGADSDFHRRDLWEAIEAGAYPEWELGIQVFTEAEADAFSFDVLDATKLIPEELVPVMPIGRMVLNRNPDNFFAETEQVAFCTAHVVPGIDFSNDPLLAGRIHSYLDTQISRLGGANFHEIPINSPVAPVHNNQRDGMHRQVIPRGRVAYEPNSLGGGCPFQAGAKGFVSFPERISDDKVRGKPEKFAEHYAQATLFFDSQTPAEQAHIIAAFRFELSKVTVPAIRGRMLASLANVSATLAAEVALGLGIPVPTPMPRAVDKQPAEVASSPALSLTALPGERGISTRRVAIILAEGFDFELVQKAREALTRAGAMSTLVATRLGVLNASNGKAVNVEATFENSPSVLFDAMIAPDVLDNAAFFAQGQVTEFIQTQFRHCKTIGVGHPALLRGIGIPVSDEKPLAGIINLKAPKAIDNFLAAVAQHRHFSRETDPPLV